MADHEQDAPSPSPRLVPRLAPLLVAAGVVVLIAAVVLLGGALPLSPRAASPSPGATSSAAASSRPLATGSASPLASGPLSYSVETFPVPAGSHPHDVAPAVDGGVWYTAQAIGKLGWLDPATGVVQEIPLGTGSAPHGVIVGPDGFAYVTDPGLGAIVSVDPTDFALVRYLLPGFPQGAGLHTATFARDALWFTGQRGFVGTVDLARGFATTIEAPRGAGPYGICATPGGDVYFASLAGGYLGAVDQARLQVTVLEPPTANAGPRRCWSDSRGRIWVSEWNVGQVGVYDPADGSWREWKLPGDAPMAYAVFVDDRDVVWLTDFGANAIVRFDPTTEAFRSFVLDSQPAEVRQLLGRAGEVWGAESAADRLVVVRAAGS